jgi:Tol biopolymer transport system component
VGEASVSANGRYVAFATSATNLVVGQADTNDNSDVFVRDMTTKTTTLVSRARSGGPAGASASPRMSADGSTVAFLGYQADQLTGETDTNIGPDLFVWDRVSGQLELITKASAGGAAANGSTSDKFSLSADGRVVAFVSTATNLVAGVRDANNAPPGTLPTLDYWQGDVYLRRRSANQTVLVSHSVGDITPPATTAATTR